MSLTTFKYKQLIGTAEKSGTEKEEKEKKTQKFLRSSAEECRLRYHF